MVVAIAEVPATEQGSFYLSVLNPTLHATTNVGGGWRWYYVAAISFLTVLGKVENGVQKRVSGRCARFSGMQREKVVVSC